MPFATKIMLKGNKIKMKRNSLCAIAVKITNQNKKTAPKTIFAHCCSLKLKPMTRNKTNKRMYK